jgi:hypothetical protein
MGVPEFKANSVIRKETSLVETRTGKFPRTTHIIDRSSGYDSISMSKQEHRNSHFNGTPSASASFVV